WHVAGYDLEDGLEREHRLHVVPPLVEIELGEGLERDELLARVGRPSDVTDASLGEPLELTRRELGAVDAAHGEVVRLVFEEDGPVERRGAIGGLGLLPSGRGAEAEGPRDRPDARVRRRGLEE